MNVPDEAVLDLEYYKEQFETEKKKAVYFERRTRELEKDVVGALKRLDGITRWLQMGLEP